MDNNFLLKKFSLNYLSKYDSSKSNLERVLRNKIRRMNLKKREKFILYNLITSIINELESKKIINDKAYADSKIHNLSLQGKSKFFVKSYLIQKGIEKDLINETLDNYELKNPNWETKSAKIFAKKKRLGTNNPNFLDKDLAKMARAGFDYNTSKKILGYE